MLAPKRIRPDMTYRVYVIIMGMTSDNVTIRAILSNNGVQYASGVVEFHGKGSKTVLVKASSSVLTAR